ncbi:amino-acid racemase [Vibrio sp. vnigr-6D03]|uniref:amino-acid racemase n=1 Tax=Vibrio sp. vnigr-6D03 TaxID=2058088 RepID=UPI000C339E13|nr:amino-acid racemase [Vibrio sp. vnigr-6D03]PKF80364.1 amino-acid racemase [Vibrio sp. vnigr-6D03]
MKNIDIAFLHTSPVHIDTFNTLIRKHAPNLKTTYSVREDILKEATVNGVNANVAKSTEEEIRKLAAQSKLTICTCSTLGGVVEKAALLHDLNAIRIDRAMADAAIKYDNVLVLAALESTLLPTEELMNQSCCNTLAVPNIEYQLIPNAWECFMKGDSEGYFDLIARTLLAKEDQFDAIVLAQASMAGALSTKPYSIPVLSSPELGIVTAIQDYFS